MSLSNRSPSRRAAPVKFLADYGRSRKALPLIAAVVATSLWTVPAGAQGAKPRPAAATSKKSPTPKPDKPETDTKDAKKDPSPDEKALRGVVVIERGGQAVALGAVLFGDGRILSALSPLGTGNDLDARFADGSVAKVKLGHHDRTWDLALLVPQTGKWSEGLSASAKDPIRPDAAIRSCTNVRNKLTTAPIVLRGRRTLLGADDKPLENALELGSRVMPTDLGTPVIDEEGRVVAILGRGCAPNENRPCTPVAFGIPTTAIKGFLRSVPPAAVAPAPWLGIQGMSEPNGIAKGVRVLSVAPKSPAEDAHLRGGDHGEGDVVLAVDGVPVTTADALAEAIRGHGVGEKVPLTLLSQGKYREISVVLRAAPEVRATAPANPAELPPAAEASEPAKKPGPKR